MPDIYDNLIQQQRQAPVDNVLRGTIDPDQAAQNIDTAKQLNVPTGVVQAAPGEAQAAVAKQQVQGWFGSDWDLSKAYSDSYNAAAAKDDTGTMAELFQNLKKMKEDPFGSSSFMQTPLVSGIKEAYEGTVYATNAAQHLASKKLGTEDTALPLLQQYEAGAKTRADASANDSPGDYVARTVGHLLGSTAGNIGAIGGGAAAGALTGSVVPGVGTAAGAIGGAAAGFSVVAGAQTAGMIYRQLELDKNGNNIPESTKTAAAIIGGVTVGSLSMVGGGVAGKALNSVFKDYVAQPLVAYTLTRGLGELGKAGLEGAALNAGMSIVQNMTTAFAKNNLSAPSWAETKTIFKEAASAALEGAIAMSILRVPSVGKSVWIDTLRQEQAKNVRDFFNDAMRTAEQSKTKARSPDVAENLLNYAADPKTETVRRPVETVPEGTVPPGANQHDVDVARATGGDVVVPQSTYLARTPGEEFQRTKDDVSLNGALTVNEAKAVSDYHERTAAAGAAQEVVAEDARERAMGPPKMELAKQETPKGTTGDTFKLQDPEGRFAPTDIVVTPNEEGKSIRIDWIGNEAGEGAYGQHGNSVLKQALKLLKGQYPWATKIEGERIGGARPAGTETSADIPDFTPKATPQEVSLAGKVTPEPMRVIPGHDQLVSPATHQFVPKPAPGGEKYAVPTVDVAGQWFHGAIPEEAMLEAKKTYPTLGEPGTTTIEKQGFVVPHLPTEMQGPPQLAVTQARAAMWLDPLFQNGAAVGMTDANFARYSKKLMDLQTAQDKSVFTAAEKLAEREKTKQWRDDRAKIQVFVENQIRSRQDVMADTYFRTGRDPEGNKQPLVKMNREAVDALFTPGDSAELLGATRASESLPKSYVGTGKDTLTPDQLASLFGFDSGREMVQGIAELHNERVMTGITPDQQIKAMIADETNRSLEATHGNPADHAFNTALEAMLSEPQIDFLSEEAAHLALLSGEKAITKEQVKALAKARVKEMSVKSGLDVDYWERIVARNGLKAHDALLRDKIDEAFIAKQQQAQALAILKEVYAFKREANQLAKIAARYTSDAPISPDKGSMQMVAHIQGQMRRFGYPIARNETELNDTLSSLLPIGHLMDDLFQAGVEIPLPDWIMQPSSMLPKNWGIQEGENQWTVDTFRAWKDWLTAMDKTSREIGTIRAGQKLLKHQEVVDEFVGNMQRTPVLPEAQFRAPSTIQRGRFALRNTMRRWDDQLLIAETLGDWFDKWDPTGPFNTVVQQPLHAAEALENDLIKAGGRAIKSLSDSMPKGWTATLRDKVPNTVLKDWRTNSVREFTRDQMLQIALNFGNESNIEKLTTPVTVSPLEGGEQYQVQLGTRAEIDQFLEENMMKEDWQYVQGIWDIYKALLPKINDMSRRITGVGIERIEPTPVFSRHGQFDGGYYPLLVDQDWHGEGAANPKDGLLGEHVYARSTPNRRYTKTRTGAAYPVELSGALGSWNRGVPQWVDTYATMVHDVAFREPVINAQKFLWDPRVQDQIAARYGNDRVRMLKNWLYDVANPGHIVAVGTRNVSAMNSTLNNIRMRVVAVEMGVRLATTAKHTISMISHVAGELGMKDTATRFVAEFYRQRANPAKWTERAEEIYALSGYMRNRAMTWDRDITEMARQALGQSGVRAFLMRNSGFMIQYADQFFANIQWKVVYNHQLEQGREQGDAIFIADKSVRQAHGDAGIVTVPSIMRANEFTKLVTIAYTFFNDSYNRLRDAGERGKQGYREAKAGNANKAFENFWRAMWMVSCYAVIPGMFETLGQNDHQKKDEGWLKSLAHGTGDIMLGTQPLLRDVVRAFQHKPTDASFISVGTAVYQGQQDLMKIMAGKRAKNAVKDTIVALAYLGSLPGGRQLGITAQAMHDLMTGAQRPHGPSELARTLAFGKPNSRAK
jgi:hypothetical protein